MLGRSKNIFLTFFLRQSWLINKMKTIFFGQLNLFGKYFGIKLAKNFLKLIFLIKIFDNKYLCWKHKIHQKHVFSSEKHYPV
jgi:hypothetical protein